MSRLTEQSFWEAGYSSGTWDQFDAETGDRRRWRAWHDAAFWERLLPQFLDKRAGQKVVEVGAAPARNLLRLHKRFGLDPWGVEYTEAGVAASRARLERIGCAPDQILQADVFDAEALKAWEGTFDVAFSMGFIEHFDDPSVAVSRHLDLLKPGGLLVVTVPAYVGLNLSLMMFFWPELVEMHNLDVMRVDALRATLDTARARLLHCAPYGTVNLAGFTTRPGPKRHLLRVLRGCQALLDLGLNAGLGRVAPQVEGVAPYLALVAEKTA